MSMDYEKQTLFEGDSPEVWARRKKMLFASVTGYAMDGLDMLILSFVMTAILSEFGLTMAQGGLIATYTLIGAVLGGYIFGIMADYYGRVKIFALTIITFSIFTGLCATATSVDQLNIYRFLAGLGIGGEFGIGMTLVAETWPSEKRARATAYVAIGWQVGVILAAVVAAIALPIWGWRGAFWIGVLPALFATWSRISVPEPDMWINRHRERKYLQGKKASGQILSNQEAQTLENANKFPLIYLFKNRRTSVTTIGLTIMTAIQNFGYYGIMIWLPTLLMRQHNLNINRTTAWMIITVLGGMVGMYIFGHIADRFGRRNTFIGFYLLWASTVYTYSQLTSPTSLLLGGALLGLCCSAMMGGYGAVLSELYPTEARSTAQNFIFNSGRAVGGFAPMVIGSWATAYSLNIAMSMLAFIFIAGALVVFFILPETKGMQLTDASAMEVSND